MSVEKAKNVPPFVLWCSATIPTAFDDSMSYYEALCALYKFIQDNLVEPINNNATVLEKTVEDMKALKEYVDTYFDNLDVQEEINNKLDEMAEGGQLATIIAQFLAASPVFGYATISDMAAATNLANGCIARVLGNTDATAGDGAYYKIRTKESGETADGVKKVAIGDDLIADRIINLPLKDRKVIIIGDSYATPSNSWAYKIKSYANFGNSECNLSVNNGSGFVNAPSGIDFEALLTTNITLPADEVTDIIVCGGWNDYNSTESQITTAIHSFIDTATSTYPNANIYIGFIGWFNSQLPNISDGYPFPQLNKVRNAYQTGCNYGTKTHYLNNVEYALHNQADFDTSYYHPNEAGQVKLANHIMRAWQTGSTNVNSNLEEITSSFTPSANMSITASSRLWSIIENQTSRIVTTFTNGGSFRVDFDGTTVYNLGDNNIKLGTISGGYVIGRGSTTAITVSTFVATADSKFYKIPSMLFLNRGELYWRPRIVNDDHTNWVTATAISFVQFDSIKLDVDSMEQY